MLRWENFVRDGGMPQGDFGERFRGSSTCLKGIQRSRYKHLFLRMTFQKNVCSAVNKKKVQPFPLSYTRKEQPAH
ncbi:hypothetical protein CBG53_00625 [Porphyromonas gingivalis]|nr:hypothetical protein CBG53_00625 [Porphyromonas gingivalis]